jgi:hypothetical protein
MGYRDVDKFDELDCTEGLGIDALLSPENLYIFYEGQCSVQQKPMTSAAFR